MTSPEPFADRLHTAVERTQSPAIVGLDPHLALLPEEFEIARSADAPREERVAAIEGFLTGILEVAAGKVPAVKPQSAFFEVFGADGVAAFERLTAAAKEAGMLVLADVKRGDIGSTAAAYAEAFLTGPGGGSNAAETPHLADAATVNPYLGSDSIQPFLDACRASGAGIYVLVRTSNPSSSEFQALTVDPGVSTLSDRVADAVASWGESVMGTSGWSSVGAVTGATHRDELRALRERMPRTPLLLPGYGAQGAGADDVKDAFTDGLHGALVNSSRGILYAYRQWPELHWKDAAARAIDEMSQALRSALLPG